MTKRVISLLMTISLLSVLCAPAYAAEESQRIDLSAGQASLTYKISNGISIPIGAVTKVKRIDRNVLINDKYDGPWQETCIDGSILYCESGAKIEVTPSYGYNDDSVVCEYSFYSGSCKPAEIERSTGDVCLVEYADFELSETGDILPLSVDFDGSYTFPDGTYYIELIGSEMRKNNDGLSSQPSIFPCAQFVVVVGEASSSADAATFSDVPSNAYYADAVDWAVNREITSGTTATTFSPDLTCTCAQIITFLWRAAGSPEPNYSVAISDVEADKYYYKAAVWAAENGMFSGSSFSPNTPCTRAMAVEFMWKWAGSPITSKSSFSDVSPTASYAQAVSWALSEGVTSGTSSTMFSPANTCTRAQIVTFLYRAQN